MNTPSSMEHLVLSKQISYRTYQEALLVCVEKNKERLLLSVQEWSAKKKIQGLILRSLHSFFAHIWQIVLHEALQNTTNKQYVLQQYKHSLLGTLNETFKQQSHKFVHKPTNESLTQLLGTHQEELELAEAILTSGTIDHAGKHYALHTFFTHQTSQEQTIQEQEIDDTKSSHVQYADVLNILRNMQNPSFPCDYQSLYNQRFLWKRKKRLDATLLDEHVDGHIHMQDIEVTEEIPEIEILAWGKRERSEHDPIDLRRPERFVSINSKLNLLSNDLEHITCIAYRFKTSKVVVRLYQIAELSKVVVNKTLLVSDTYGKGTYVIDGIIPSIDELCDDSYFNINSVYRSLKNNPQAKLIKWSDVNHQGTLKRIIDKLLEPDPTCIVPSQHQEFIDLFKFLYLDQTHNKEFDTTFFDRLLDRETYALYAHKFNKYLAKLGYTYRLSLDYTWFLQYRKPVGFEQLKMHSNYLRYILHDYTPAVDEDLWICLNTYLETNPKFFTIFTNASHTDRQALCRTIGVNNARVVRKHGFIWEYPDMLAQQIHLSLPTLTPQLRNKYHQVFEVLLSTKLLDEETKKQLKNK
jgi:hypothetical protein